MHAPQYIPKRTTTKTRNPYESPNSGIASSEKKLLLLSRMTISAPLSSLIETHASASFYDRTCIGLRMQTTGSPTLNARLV